MTFIDIKYFINNISIIFELSEEEKDNMAMITRKSDIIQFVHHPEIFLSTDNIKRFNALKEIVNLEEINKGGADG